MMVPLKGFEVIMTVVPLKGLEGIMPIVIIFPERSPEIRPIRSFRETRWDALETLPIIPVHISLSINGPPRKALDIQYMSISIPGS